MYKLDKIILFVSKTKRNHGLEWWVDIAYHFVYPDLGRLSRGLTVTGTKLTLAELIDMVSSSFLLAGAPPQTCMWKGWFSISINHSLALKKP